MTDAASNPTPAPGPQFSLRQLFLGVTLLGASLGFVVWLGTFGLLLLYPIGWILAASVRWVSWMNAIVAVCLGVFVLMLLPTQIVSTPSRPAPGARCTLRLKQIQVALETYAQHNGS
jgi:MFS family permease